MILFDTYLLILYQETQNIEVSQVSFQSLKGFLYTFIRHSGIKCHTVFLSAKGTVSNFFIKFSVCQSVFNL